MRATPLFAIRTVIVLLLGAWLIFGQSAAKKETLLVKGYTGEVPVVQVNGKSYVQIESLARLTGGSISFHGTQITLALAPPDSNMNQATNQATTQPDSPEKPALSKDFMRAGIDALTMIREWRVALLNAIRNSSVSEDSVSGYARDAESRLAQVSAAVYTGPDRDALAMFNTEFANMRQLSDKYLALRKSMTYIPPDSLDNDKLDQQIQGCGRGLAALATSGQPHDVPTCH